METIIVVAVIVVTALFANLHRQIAKMERKDTVFRKTGSTWIKVEL
ncbi:hypothetical protein [Hydrogenimonas sp.]